MKLLFVITYLFVIINFGFAQKSEPSYIQAYKTTEKIKLDGKLIEKIWQEAPHINNFTQRDLDFGQAITEKTEVAVIYDKNAIYIGV